MERFLLFIIVIANVIHLVFGQCIPNPNVTPGPNDPPFPTLADTFSTTIEVNIKDKNYTSTAKEYYDDDNKISSIVLEKQGNKYMLLFDYKNDQLFYIIPGQQCATANLSTDNNNELFGPPLTNGALPHMYNTNGALHFLKKSGQKYMGQTYVRGILTDHWSTCLTWSELNATFTLDYFFTATNWTTAVGLPQLPVRAIAIGNQLLPNGTTYHFEHYYEYIDFTFDIDDYTVFETPKGVYCPGKKSTRPLPQVSPAFHFQSDVISPQSTDIRTFSVWYDSGLKLLRRDYRLSIATYPSYSTNPLSDIIDYNTGIRYITDKVSGNCTILPITASSTDTATSIGPNGDSLKDPSSFLFLDANYTYSGVKYARGVQCDVYTARHVYPFNNKLYNATLDYYFLTKQFKEYPSDGSSAPQDIPFRLEATLTVPLMPNLLIKHDFYDYDTSKRSLSDFDISACYELSKSIRFRIRFPGTLRPFDQVPFLLSAQRILPAIMNISSIRLQSPRLDYAPKSVTLAATLIDVAPSYAKFVPALTIQRPTSNVPTKQVSDKAYTFAGQWQDCADYCIQNYDFVCNSFDSCPSNGNCYLYKDRRTDIQSFLNTTGSSPCFNYTVYQRTVAGTPIQETAIIDAYGNLQTAIKQNNIYLQAFDQNGFDTDYYAIESEIVAGVLEYVTMPSISSQFSYRQEITFPNMQQVYGSDVWYDYNFKIVRYDIVDYGPPYYSDNPLTHIQDFYGGVEYVIDKVRQNCSINPISSSSKYFAVNQNGAYRMGTPLEVFHMNSSYTFVGQKTIRGMTANMFQTVLSNYKVNPNDPDEYETTFQYYFLKEEWTGKSDTKYETTNSPPIRLDVSSAQKGFFITYNYYNWNNDDPDINRYNVVPCFPADQQKHFVIVFGGDYDPYISSMVQNFKLLVQNQVSQVANASLTRFQQVELDSGLSTIYVIMTVVEQAPQFDGVAYNQEPDIDAIMRSLNNNIYSGLFSVSFAYNGTIQVYKAMAIMDNVLRNDGRPLSSKTLSHFKVMKDKSQKTLSGHLAGISVDDCADACLTELDFDCESFVYCYQTGYCLLAKTYAQSNSSLVYDRPKCDLYYRSYLDKFTPSPGQTPALTSAQTTTAGTAEACAQTCFNSNSCKSFVYCEVAKTCSTFNDRHLTMPSQTNTNGNGNDFCAFYSRNYLNDFKYKSRSTIKFSTQTLSVSAVSVDDCARLCVETQSSTCNSFSFCGNDTTCRLTPAHPVTGLSTVATDYCDTYTRTYYPSSTARLKQSTTKSGSGYTSGTVAGISIGVFILGLIVGGALIIILSKKQKLPQMEIFNMNYENTRGLRD